MIAWAIKDNSKFLDEWSNEFGKLVDATLYPLKRDAEKWLKDGDYGNAQVVKIEIKEVVQYES